MSSPPDTRERILDTAEVLFADGGVAATSLREITRKASVNLAAVNYHFGSKAGLLRAILERRFGPLNHERLAVLDRLEAEAGNNPLDVDRILEAFLRPAVHLVGVPATKGSKFPKLLARVMLEPAPELQTILVEQFDQIRPRYLGALGKALPHLPQREVALRMHFLVGSMAHTLSHLGLIQETTGLPAARDGEALDGLVRRMVAYAAGGFRAPLDGSIPPRHREDAP